MITFPTAHFPYDIKHAIHLRCLEIQIEAFATFQIIIGSQMNIFIIYQIKQLCAH